MAKGSSSSRQLRIIGAVILVAVIGLMAATFLIKPPESDGVSEDEVPPVDIALIDPERWVDEACPRLAEFNTAVVGGQEDAPSGVETVAERRELKAYFVALYEEGAETAEAAARDIAAIGAPDVPGGRTLVEELRRSLLSARADMVTASRDLSAAEVEDAAAFRTALIDAATGAQTGLTPYSEALTALGASPDLGPLVAEAEGCSP